MTRKQKKMVARIAASAVLLVAAVLIPYEGPWRFVLFLPAYFVIGWDVLWKAARNIAHGQVFDENFLMALATVGAFCTGFFGEGQYLSLIHISIAFCDCTSLSSVTIGEGLERGEANNAFDGCDSLEEITFPRSCSCLLYTSLPFPVISAAANGDTTAMCAILKHYEGYIAKLCTRTLKDDAGNTYSYVDEEMRNRLQVRLITRTLAFHVG